MEKDVNITEFKGDAKNLVNAIDEIKEHSDGLDKTLQAVLTHLNDIEKGLKNVKTNTNNAKLITNNVNAKNNTNLFDFGTQQHVVKSSTGFMVSGSGRGKAFQQYQQAVIKETEEITKDVAERRKLRKQRADAETKTAGASLLRANKLEDQTSARYLDRMDKLAEAKMLNAKANQVGAYLKDPRYQAGRAISAIGGVVNSFGTGGKLLGGLLDSVGMLVKSPVAGTAAAVTNLVKGVTDLGSEAVKAYSEIEATKTQLGIVFSSQTQANTAFGELSQYAVHSPFGIQQTSELAVLLKQSGVYASDLMDTLRMLGDTAGGNMEKMKRIANNYAQIVSIGKASMLDMRQFAYAGIPIFEAVSKELGVSQQELRKLISDGKVTSDIIEKVFKDLTGINGIFENATEIGAKTLKARLQNLSDASQLAFASAGEWIMNVGTKTGGDSYGLRLVSWAEKIFQEIHENIDTRNIEKSVKTIEERENRIRELQLLSDKYSGNPEMEKILEQALKVQVDKRDIEKDRSTYEASYQNKVGNRNALLALSQDSLSKYEYLLDAIEGGGSLAIQGLKSERTKGLVTGGVLGLTRAGVAQGELSQIYKKIEDMGFNLKEIEKMNPDERKEVVEVIREAIKALKGVSELTEEEIRAHRETIIADAQQLAFDKASKASGLKESYTSGFEELFSLYRDSEEYKEKETKARIEFLNEAKDMLKELLKYADKEGNIDITKMTYDTFVKYLDEDKRVLNEGVKLNLVENDKRTEAQLTEDRKIFTEQWTKVTRDIESLLRSGGNSQAADEMQNMMRAYDLTGDNVSYFRNMNIILEAQNGILEDLYNNTKDEKYRNMLTALWGSSFKYQQGSEGLNANPEDLLKGTKYDFIPLWKRILSSKTGLTTNGMTDTISTMTNYRDDMAIRNMTSGVLSATMKSIGVDTAMSLMKTNSAVQLAGDNGKTFQVDWLSTKKAIKDFSTQLSASTQVITAYKNGLQAELDTYEQLIAAGYTEAESTDLGSQKFVSTKQLQKLALGNSSQLVNAFGEVLETATGKKYKTSEIEFKNGEMFDKFGNKIEEEVVMTGNLFNFIKEELPRIYNEIHEANAQQLNNEAISKMLTQITPSAYMSRVLQMGTSPEHIAFLGSNSDYIEKFIKSKIDELKASETYKNTKLGGMANDDIIMRALNASEEMKSLYERRIALEERYQRALNDETGVYNPELDLSLIENQIAQLDRELSQFGSEGEETATAIRLLNDVFKALDENVSKLVDTNEYALLLQQIKNLPQTNALNTAVQNILGAYGLDNIPESKQNIPENYEGPRGERNWALKALGWNTDLFDKEDLYLALAQAGYFRDANGKDKFWDYEEDKSLIPSGIKPDDFVKMLDEPDKKAADMAYQFEKMNKTIKDMAAGLLNAVNDFSKGSWLAPFEQLGDYLVTGENYAQGLSEKMRGLGAEMISQMGNYMAQAGFSLVTMGAQSGSWATIGAGLALAAAGGFASGLGGALREGEKSKDKTNKEAQKIENLKNDLQKLLEQARTDALYYENNLRHKTALGTNREFSYKSVHDAVITPQGNVVTTDPKDYLIATKTPQNFVGGGNVTVSPVINCNVVNNSSAQVRTEQTQNADGSIDIVTIIEEVAGGYISSARSDSAFEARNIRMRGTQAIM